MTMFGKMLVIFIFLLSMLFTGWTIGVYTERVEWAPVYGLFSGERLDNHPGTLDGLAKEIELAVERREVAERRWQAAFLELPRVEQRRLEYLKWYGDLLHATTDGNDKTGNALKPPVIALVRNPDTKDFVREDPKPFKRIGIDFENDKPKEEDLQYAEYYERKIKEVREQIKKQQEMLDALVQEHTKLSEEIAGVARTPKEKGLNDRFIKEKSGLQDKRDDQVAYLKNCVDEQMYLQPLVNNMKTELVILAKRQAALKARVKELEKVAVNR